MFKQFGHVLGRGVGGDLHAGIQEFAHRSLRLVGKHDRQLQHAYEMIFPVHHHEAVGMGRQLTQLAQVAGYNVQGHVGPDRYHVYVHQAAGGVLRVGHDGSQALPVLHVHGQQHAVRHAFGKVVEDVRQVVRIQVLGRLGNFVRMHLLQQAGAHRVLGMGQHLAGHVRVDEAPDEFAVPGRLALQQVGDLGGVHLAQLIADTTKVLRLQGLQQAFLYFFFRHSLLPGSRWR